jgi:hypothetical protein
LDGVDHGAAQRRTFVLEHVDAGVDRAGLFVGEALVPGVELVGAHHLPHTTRIDWSLYMVQSLFALGTAIVGGGAAGQGLVLFSGGGSPGRGEPGAAPRSADEADPSPWHVVPIGIAGNPSSCSSPRYDFGADPVVASR